MYAKVPKSSREFSTTNTLTRQLYKIIKGYAYLYLII